MRDIGQALSLLMSRAESNLSDEDLMTLGGASEVAEMQARNLARIMDGCGALVANDEDGGWMQDRDRVAALMWHVAAVADSIASLIDLSGRVDVIRAFRPKKEAE